MPITFVTIDIPGATFGTNANGINNAGQIAGYYTDGSGTQGFLLSGGSLTTLNNPAVVNPPGEHYTLPWGINNSTQIAGSFNQGSSSAFLYSNGGYTTLASGGACRAGISGEGSTMPAKSSGIVTPRWELPTGRPAVSSTPTAPSRGWTTPRR